MIIKRLALSFLLCIVSMVALYAQPTGAGKPQPIAKEAPLFEPAKPRASASFKFAQFTDLHLSVANQQNSDDLQAAIDDLNSLKGIAFVLVTGDLTETGDLASLQLAKKLLSKLNIPYFVIPGNHETKWSASGATDFNKVFGEDRFRLLLNGYIFIGFNSGPILKMGDGHIIPEDLEWLQRQLKSAGKKKPVFLITHYPLKEGDVDNWFQVTDMARKHNVQAVIGGHYHRNMVLNYDGIPGIVGRTIMRGKASEGAYTLFQIVDSLSVYEKPIGGEPKLWATFCLDEKKYVDPDSKLRPDYSVNSQFKQVKVVWETATSSAIFSSPTVGENRLFCGNNKGMIQAYSLDKGKLLWQYQTLSRVIGSPCYADNKVYVGSTDGNLYCLSADNGSLLWKHCTKAALVSVPVIENGVLYLGCCDGTFCALDALTGQPVWSYSGIGNYVETRALLTPSLVIFGAWDSYLYALDRQSGALVWKWNNGSERVHFSPAAVWPVQAYGKVFITAPDRYLTAVDITNGKTLWRTNEHQVRETIGLSADGNTLYSRTMTDSVMAYDLTKPTPELRWITNASFGYDHNPSMLIEQNGVVAFATKNGLIVAIRAADGKVLWKHKVGNVEVHTLVAVSPNDWVLTTTDGKVMRLTVK